MKKPQTPKDEMTRLRSLHSLQILDTCPEERFDRITRIAKNHFGVSIALVSLVDENRQWFKSRQGLSAIETPRDVSFCGHAILGDETFVVSNASLDPDFADNPLVCGDPNIRFYAGAPLHAPDGARVGTLCIIHNQPRDLSAQDRSILRDLADCVEAELSLTAIREREHFLQEITDATPGLVAYWDKRLICRFANRPYLDWFGKPPEVVIGNSLQSLLGPKLFALNEPYIRGALSGEIQRFERTLTKPDGSIGHTWAVYVPDKNQAGTVEGFIVLVTDVTPFKEAERKVKEGEQRLQAILNNVQDGIVTINDQAIVISANRALSNIFGYPIGALVGQPLNRIIPNFHVDQALETNNSGSHLELEGRNNVGWGFPLEFYASEMIAGGVRQLVCVIRDITERVEATQALHKARRAAEAANLAKNRFLATVSHEIRTPIAAVLGTADLLLSSNLNAEQQGWMKKLERSTRTLLDLVNDILDFSKIEAGRMELESVDFSLNDLVEETCALFAPLALEKGNAIQVSVANSNAYRGDAKKYRQILMNLVGNANKFTSSGKISVAVRAEPKADGTVVIETLVSDTGIGIATVNHERLFEPFVQEDVSTSRKYGGTGLGLSICKKLAEFMGGRIWFSSALGKGSTFGFTVNFMIGDLSKVAKTERPEKAAALATSARHLRVLIADDNETIRMLTSTMLTRNGHTVTATSDGAAAVAAMRRDTFDIVLMDMQMPIMDGPDAMRVIRSEEAPTAHIPIIALTADALEENRVTYLAAGADSILVKPIDWGALALEMGRLTARSERNQT